jgi:hypothetical protein
MPFTILHWLTQLVRFITPILTRNLSRINKNIQSILIGDKIVYVFDYQIFISNKLEKLAFGAMRKLPRMNDRK